MLNEWLGPTSESEFHASIFGVTPFARPGTVPPNLFQWDQLDILLRTANELDTLMVARGHLLNLPPPRSLAELRRYFMYGIGCCIRNAESHPMFADLAHAAAEGIGTARVQLFVTPANTHGFGWHYDDEHVLIAQTAGAKQYWFRQNTVTRSTAAPEEFARYFEETSVMCAATLIAGDFLYLPARWWHMAECMEDSLSISIGIRAVKP